MPGGRLLTRSLGFRLIFFVDCILILAVGVFAYTFLRTYEGDLISEAKRRSARLCDTIKRGTRYDMLEFRRENVHRTIKTLGQQKGMARIRIYNKEGGIIFSTDENEIGTKVDMKAEACYICHAAKKPLEKIDVPSTSRIYSAPDKHRILGMIDPIYNEKDCYTAECHTHPETQKVLGVLDVMVSLQDIDEEIAYGRFQIIMFALICLASVFAAIGLFIHKYVTRPVRKLEQGVEAIAKGDFEFEVDATGNDEIGSLAKSFNRVREELKESYEKLRGKIEAADEDLKKAYKELQTKQEQLIQSEKLASIGKLAAGVAHEINNPLTGVLTFACLLRDDLEKDDPKREDAEVIIKETQRCSSIVRNLLDFSRQTQPQKMSMGVNEIAEKALSILEHQSAFRNIKIIREFDPALPQIMVDKDKIQQVFINLLTNAQEAMPEGGSVTITTTRTEDGKDIEVRVADTGCGIAESDLPRIFDPFFSTKEKGTGLGLSVTQGIIASHKGTIEVKSKKVAGTTFTIRLPIE